MSAATATMRSLVLWIPTLLGACGGSHDVGPDAAVEIDALGETPRKPMSFHCAKDETCPAVTIDGDAMSTDGFRGLGDPSLERAADGTLWLSYSWLDHAPLGTATLRAARTHLAKSSDGGATWTYVRTLNTAEPAIGVDALVVHQVSSIAQRADGTWHSAWLTYGEMMTGEDVQLHYQRTIAAAPEELGTESHRWLRGYATKNLATQVDSSQIVGAVNCSAFTEPALFTHEGVHYVATSCITDGTLARQRLILLRETETGLAYVGDLLRYQDAALLGGTRVEKIDLSVAKDGSIIALVTPIKDDGFEVENLGCIVLDVEDITTATIRRYNGRPVKRATITADGNGVGPGLCTYDRDSATGVLMDIVTVDAAGNTELSLRATGFHP